MKITNSTDFPDHMLRRLVAWCCRELKIPVRSIPEAVFRNREHSSSGHCSVASGRIVVSIERAQQYVITELTRPLERRWAERYKDPVRLSTSRSSGMTGERETMRLAAASLQSRQPERRLRELVRVTAHEVAHRMNWLEGSRTRDKLAASPRERERGGGSEKNTRIYEQRLLDKFSENRDALLAEWQTEPKRRASAQPPATRAARNEEKARAALKRWLSRLARARTKVRTYRAKVRRYDRIAATRGEAK